MNGAKINPKESLSAWFLYKVSLFLWQCYHSSKLRLTKARKSPANEIVVGLLSFLIVWISDTVNMVLLFFQFEFDMVLHAARTRWKICELNNFWYIFNKSWFHFHVFQQDLASLWSTRKPFSGDLKGYKVKFLVNKFMSGQNIFPYFDPWLKSFSPVNSTHGTKIVSVIS